MNKYKILIAGLFLFWFVVGYFISDYIFTYFKKESSLILMKDVIGFKFGLPLFISVLGMILTIELIDYFEKLFKK